MDNLTEKNYYQDKKSIRDLVEILKKLDRI